MTTTEMEKLQIGKLYCVKIKNKRNRRIREFYGTEKRFGSIPCAVFSTSQAAWRRQGGYSVPYGEYSIPHYELEEATEVAQGGAQ